MRLRVLSILILLTPATAQALVRPEPLPLTRVGDEASVISAARITSHERLE